MCPFQELFVGVDNLLHSCMTRCADGVTLLYTFLHADGLVYILLEYRTYSFVLLEAELVKRDVLIDALQDKLSNYAVGIAERYAVIYKVICSIGCIGESVLG